jgi:hypothetical protein
MKRSPPPTRSRAERTKRNRVDVLEGRVDGLLHPLGQLVHRLLEAGRSTSTSCQSSSFATPKTRAGSCSAPPR